MDKNDERGIMDGRNGKIAVRFVVLLGLVSLFSDMTYEAARSINGPYLEVLGTSGKLVGWVAGLGELLGYGLRLIAGYLSDRTRKYWIITIVGYLINLISVPLLAWAGHWQLAVLLMVMERVGKAIRTPARDAMLSYGAKELGRGWGFGLHEALDQIGAVIGPLLVSAALFQKQSDYPLAYQLLWVPAAIAIVILIRSARLYPHPEYLEINTGTINSKGFSRTFWLYLLAMLFIAAGFADFPLIAFHFKVTGVVKDALIPIFYSVAMASDALAALVLGKWFDRAGYKVLMVSTFVSLFFAPMVFWGGSNIAFIGMIFWGIGMGAQESVIRASVAELAPANKRGSAYGIFNTGFGFFWFLGSVVMGYLYDRTIAGLILFSLIAQVVAFFSILLFVREIKPG
jgi:MFS family permease